MNPDFFLSSSDRVLSETEALYIPIPSDNVIVHEGTPDSKVAFLRKTLGHTRFLIRIVKQNRDLAPFLPATRARSCISLESGRFDGCSYTAFPFPA